MQFEHGAGILLHPTSLPSKYGIGDLDNQIYMFIDLKKCRLDSLANLVE
jgi:4-alpha-glucanotransferase